MPSEPTNPLHGLTPTPSPEQRVTVRGTVKDGVEAGCVVLVADTGQVYLLLGRKGPLPEGEKVTVPSGREAVRRLVEAREPGAGARLDAYLDSASRAAELAERQFLFNPFTRPASLAASRTSSVGRPSSRAMASGCGSAEVDACGGAPERSVHDRHRALRVGQHMLADRAERLIGEGARARPHHHERRRMAAVHQELAGRHADRLDLDSAHPKLLTTDAVRASDVVITMGCGDACPIYPGKRYLDWDLTDPAGKTLEQIRPIRDDIDRRVHHLLAELTT